MQRAGQTTRLRWRRSHERSRSGVDGVEARVGSPARARVRVLRVRGGPLGAFVALLAASPSTLESAYEWLRALPLVWELLAWILTLPWTVAYVVYETGWAHWLRALLVAALVTVHLAACAPRERR